MKLLSTIAITAALTLAACNDAEIARSPEPTPPTPPPVAKVESATPAKDPFLSAVPSAPSVEPVAVPITPVTPKSTPAPFGSASSMKPVTLGETSKARMDVITPAERARRAAAAQRNR
jgi:hypothetical protein